MNPAWLQWAQKLQAIAQNGLTYSENPYDLDRYQQILQVVADLLANYTDQPTDVIYSLFRQEEGYATPKVDARGAVFQNDKILLVKEREDGYWTLPGGWVDVGESPSTAIEREVFEESGFKTRAVKLVALYDREHPRHGHPMLRHHVYKLFFQCEMIGGTATPSYETEAVEFFGAGEIPELSLGRVVPAQIDRLFEHYYHPDWPTDFD